jgi:hypothetical protein
MLELLARVIDIWGNGVHNSIHLTFFRFLVLEGLTKLQLLWLSWLREPSIYPWKDMLPLFSSSFFVHHFKENWYFILLSIFNTFLLVPNFLPKKLFQDQDWNQAEKCFILFFLCQKNERKSCVTRGSRERETEVAQLPHAFTRHKAPLLCR